MSSGAGVAHPAVVRTLDRLAPLFRAAIEATLAEHPDAIVCETYRSNELQAPYFERGRTVKPPAHTVTNARTNLYSWHGYGLAVDIIHRELEWNAPTSWFAQVAETAKRNGCKWGGNWKSPDFPHLQWGRCKASPSDLARRLIAEGGMEAVWHAVGAV